MVHNENQPVSSSMTAREAARGATQDEIAEIFGVATRTLQRWLARYPELCAAVQAGNDVFNPRVERALAESAIGYWVTWDEEILDAKGKVIRTIPHKQYHPPSVQAQQFWMKNRMKDKWSDVTKHEVKAPYKSSAELLADMR
ncbi:MAG: helix-turn-helix domain-containing protein [Xanthobacteraceae bacterium]